MPKDFTITKNTRTAKRTFTAPIISKTEFDGVIETLTGNTNPLGTVSYQDGTEPGTKINSAKYSSLIEFFDPETGGTVGKITVNADTRAAIDASVANILANDALAETFGEGVEGFENDAKASWSVNVRLRDPIGETYYITINQKEMKLYSFESDTILAKVEAWADSVTALN